MIIGTVVSVVVVVKGTLGVVSVTTVLKGTIVIVSGTIVLEGVGWGVVIV